MSDLRARLIPLDSGIAQFFAAADHFGQRGGVGSRALNRWCDLRRRGHPDETMADLLESGAVSEAEVRDCFEEAA